MNNVKQLDIAKKLKVSRITVSKALRDHPDISEAMKEKVRKMAAKMGYFPNLVAKNLISGKSCTIGVVIPDLENSFFAYATDTIIDVASGKNYTVFVTVSRESSQIELANIQNLIGMRVDGILVCVSKETRDPKIFEQIKEIGIPLVFFDRQVEQLNVSSIVFDDRYGAIHTLDKLIAEGYTKFAHFAGYQTTNIGRERCLGYKHALNKHNIKIREEWILEGGFNIVDGIQSFKKLYKEKKLPEVILAVNDLVALGIYREAREVGIRIPDDLGIVAYGFCETASLFSPTLSVINQDPRVMAKMTIEMLLSEIEQKTTGVKQHINLKIIEDFIWNNSLKRLQRNK
jgi:LacI family transcriptional regulator